MVRIDPTFGICFTPSPSTGKPAVRLAVQASHDQLDNAEKFVRMRCIASNPMCSSPSEQRLARFTAARCSVLPLSSKQSEPDVRARSSARHADSLHAFKAFSKCTGRPASQSGEIQDSQNMHDQSKSMPLCLHVRVRLVKQHGLEVSEEALELGTLNRQQAHLRC